MAACAAQRGAENCGSSDGGDPAYGEMAERLGRLAAAAPPRIPTDGRLL